MASERDGEAGQIARIVGQHFDAILGDEDRIGVAETAYPRRVQSRLDGEDHARLEHGVIARIEEGTFVIAQANRVAGVVLPVLHQVMLLEVFADRLIDIRAARPGAQGDEGGILQRHHVIEQALLLVGGGADDHGAL